MLVFVLGHGLSLGRNHFSGAAGWVAVIFRSDSAVGGNGTTGASAGAFAQQDDDSAGQFGLEGLQGAEEDGEVSCPVNFW